MRPRRKTGSHCRRGGRCEGQTQNSPGAEPAFWWPHLQQAISPDMLVVIRASSDPRHLWMRCGTRSSGSTRRWRWPMSGSWTRWRMNPLRRRAFRSFLVGLFAGLAIVLAAIGTYGVISYSVSQRIPEFGLRLALGAPPATCCAWCLRRRRSLRWGAVAGLIVALGLARVLRSMMYNVSPADPLTFTAVGDWWLRLRCSPAICRRAGYEGEVR
jgi:hypothetical protein